MLHTSPWKVFRIGVYLGLLLLHAAPARAQTVERTVWTCGDMARAGQPVGVDGNCPIVQQRWDVGGLTTLLYAQCSLATCAASTDYQNAVWRRWQDVPANGWLFGCPGPRAPGPWGDCAGERFYPRDQIAASTPPACSPDMPPGETRIAQCPAPQTGSWEQNRVFFEAPAPQCWVSSAWLPVDPPPGACTDPPPPAVSPPENVPLTVTGRGYDVELTWPAAEVRHDGSAITGALTYSVETVVGAVLALATEPPYRHVDPPPGRRCYRVYVIEDTLREPFGSQDGACATVPHLIQPRGTSSTVPAGGSFVLSWTHNGLPSDCRGSWAPAVDLPQVGQQEFSPTVATQYAISCTTDGTTTRATFDVAIAAFVPPTLDCLPIDLAKVSPVRAIQGMVEGEGAVRSILATLGLQSLDAGRLSAYGWTCDLPNRNVPEWFVINWDAFNVDCARGVEGNALKESFWRAVWNACTKPHTQREDELGRTLAALYRPKFTVLSGAATQPVYTRTAAGARGPRLVIGGVQQSIATGQPCDGRRRLSGTTRYNAVDGMLSSSGQVLPLNSYSRCAVTQAPSTGWPEP